MSGSIHTYLNPANIADKNPNALALGVRQIQSSTDASDLRDAREEDAIHFCTFKTTWDESLNAWQLKFNRRVSTNTEGVRKMLGGAHEDRLPTITEFQNKISARLLNADV